MNIVAWADNLNLENLVPYTERSAAWSDHHSWITLTWTRPDASGIQSAEALLGWGGTPLTDQLLTWSVFEGNRTLDLRLQTRLFRPDTVTEVDEGQDLRLTA